jgi:hypothetical protein
MEKNIKNKQDAEIAIRYYLKGYRFTNKNNPYIITYAHAQTLQGTFNGAGKYTFYGMIEYKEDNGSKEGAYQNKEIKAYAIIEKDENGLYVSNIINLAIV